MPMAKHAYFSKIAKLVRKASTKPSSKKGTADGLQPIKKEKNGQQYAKLVRKACNKRSTKEGTTDGLQPIKKKGEHGKSGRKMRSTR